MYGNQRLCGWRLSAVVLFVIGIQLYSRAETYSDKEINRAITTGLSTDKAVDAHLVDVSVDNGFVTLSGSVANLLSKDRAERICMSLNGVRGIMNELHVVPVHRKPGEIRKDVNRALSEDPVTERQELSLSVQHDTVILKGYAHSISEKMLVAETVKGIRGVSCLVNMIEVRPAEPPGDEEIRREVEGLLDSDPFVYAKMITVAVSAGMVQLTGTVGSFSEKMFARLDCYVPGAKAVRDTGLTVKFWAGDPLRREGKLVIKSDSTIVRELKELFEQDPLVLPYRVSVSMDHGTVTLRGKVGTLRAKRQAEESALHLVGVYSVKNEIKVRPTTTVADTIIKSIITMDLQRDPIVGRHALKVVVRNAKAYLYGAVDNLYEQRHATRIVEKIPGIVAVANLTEIRENRMPWLHLNDELIKENILREYHFAFLIDPLDLTVEVRDGVATISGSIESALELDAIIRHAFDSGAKMVVTQLLFNGRKEYGAYDYRNYAGLD
jgi:osmotically-inducible protein OsmY